MRVRVLRNTGWQKFGRYWFTPSAESHDHSFSPEASDGHNKAVELHVAQCRRERDIL